jgi:hypothetical protein
MVSPAVTGTLSRWKPTPYTSASYCQPGATNTCCQQPAATAPA